MGEEDINQDFLLRFQLDKEVISQLQRNVAKSRSTA